MATERFEGKSDGRSDVYALGATLYEMLTLRPAFEGRNQIKLMERILHEPPVPPRQIDRRIPLDMETIVLKAMAKSPAHRYPTAEAMAEDLKLFGEGRPIRSRPIPFYQRFGRWCKRNPKLAAANIAAAALTTILAVVSTVAAVIYYERNRQVEEDKQRIQLSERQAREKLFDSLVSEAQARRLSRRKGQRFETLNVVSRATQIGHELNLPPERFDPLRDEAIACMALPDLQLAGPVITLSSGVAAYAFDSTMSRCALRFRDGTIVVRRFPGEEVIARFQARGDRDIWVFALSPDGRYLANRDQPGSTLTVWDIERGCVALEGLASVGGARFSPDSRQIALVKNGGDVIVHDLATGQLGQCWPKAHNVAFRHDGSQVALIYEEKTWTCRILQTDTGKIVRSISLPMRPGAGLEPRWRHARDAVR